MFGTHSNYLIAQTDTNRAIIVAGVGLYVSMLELSDLGLVTLTPTISSLSTSLISWLVTYIPRRVPWLRRMILLSKSLPRQEQFLDKFSSVFWLIMSVGSGYERSIDIH